MAAKIRKYFGYNAKAKILVIMLAVTLLVLSFGFLAWATGGPSITISPVDGSTISQVRPVINATISSTINNSMTIFRLNGNQVQPSYDDTKQILTYTPEYDLPDGTYTVDVTVYDLSGNSSNVTTNFTVKTSRPVLSNISPSTTISNKSPYIMFNISDPDQIDNNSLRISIDGNSVQTSLAYKELGYWDNYGYYVKTGTDYTNASVSYLTSNLPVGVHQVRVSVADKLGNLLNYSWSFEVANPPTVTAASPADGSFTNNNKPTLSASVSNGPGVGDLDVTSTKVLLDSIPINFTYDAASGTITVPVTSALADGKHNWEVDAKSVKGLTSIYKASFSINTKGPTLKVYPVVGTIVTTPIATKVGFDFTDVSGLDEQKVEMYIDGNPVTPTIKYNEVWVYPPYQEPYFSGYDYTKGSVYYMSPALMNGTHTASFIVTDKAGNVATGTTNFSYAVPFNIANTLPANNSVISNPTPAISFMVTNNSQANWSSLTMNVDGTAVTPQIDTAQGVVTYQTTVPLAEGAHKVSASVSDVNGKMATSNWTFSYFTPGPRLTVTPDDGVTVNKLVPNQDNDKIKINFSDPNSAIDGNSAVLKVNGQTVPVTISYNEIWDTNLYTGDPVFEGYDYSNGKIISNTNFTDGSYAVTFEIKDKAGYVKDKNWNFNVSVPPQATSISPADKASVNSLKPHFSIQLSDPNGPAIDTGSLQLYIDDTLVNSTFTQVNQTSGKLDYDAAFKSEGNHTAKLVMADTLGNSSTSNWSIYVNSYGEMDVNPQSCSACHSIDQYNKHVHTKGPDLEITGGTATHGQQGTCGHCHTKSNTPPINDPDYCSYCHGDPNPMVGPYPAGSYPAQANKSCLDCHSKKDTWTGAYTMPVVTGYPNEPQPTVPVVHNIYGIHTVNNTGCTACHADNLTREHNIRKDANGQAFTCNTCHKSTRQEVIDAIKNKTTDCNACHSLSDNHETVHTDSLDNNCQTCHKSTISQEHLNNPKTQTKQLDCKSCHQSQRQEVQQAIASQNLNCSACHGAAHGLPLAKVTPTDIPLYPQLTWAGPLTAGIWTGESWMPDEFTANGLVLISNRSTVITGDAVWNFYNQQLTAKGWTLAGTAPVAGSNFYSVTFTKSDSVTNLDRKVLINFYGGDNHTSGPVLASGYRIEIVYK